MIWWGIGMALAGAVFESKGSYAQTWYGLIADSSLGIGIGAAVGVLIVYAFFAQLPKNLSIFANTKSVIPSAAESFARE
jgi:hypothetical protein